MGPNSVGGLSVEARAATAIIEVELKDDNCCSFNDEFDLGLVSAANKDGSFFWKVLRYNERRYFSRCLTSNSSIDISLTKSLED